MIFKIDFKSGKAVYVQLIEQIKHAVASGALLAQDALPSIRPLAEQLHLNRNTIAKAYEQLEQEGIIETIAGKGSFVSDRVSPLSWQQRHAILLEKVDAACVAAYQLQLDANALIELTRERSDYFNRRIANNTGLNATASRKASYGK